MELIVDNVGHDYGETQVLRDISFTVSAGEIVCIIGPSGCGKSTLLRFIGGLERPDAGQVLRRGEPPAGSLNPLTYIFQDFALLPWRTRGRQCRPGAGGPRHPARRGARAIIDDVLARTNCRTSARRGRGSSPAA